MAVVMEYQWRIFAENRRKQDAAKQNALRINDSKKASRTNKRGGSFENILKAIANLRSDTNTTEDSTNSVLQGILSLSSDTLKYDFFHLGGNISECPNLKKWKVAVGISQRWGKHIMKEEAMILAEEEDRGKEGSIT